MPNLPFSPTNPVQPSDFMKNDVPAETDDLQLGNKTSEDAGKANAERNRDDRPGSVPQAGRP
jgi:hypothetical protein